MAIAARTNPWVLAVIDSRSFLIDARSWPGGGIYILLILPTTITMTQPHTHLRIRKIKQGKKTIPPSIHQLDRRKGPLSIPIRKHSRQVQLIFQIWLLFPICWYNQCLRLCPVSNQQTCWWLQQLFVHDTMLYLRTVLLLLLVYMPIRTRLWLMLLGQIRRNPRRRIIEERRIGIRIFKVMIMLRNDISS